ncbi:glycosyltransferase, partial [bacterium]|nr:glycosyltransferase [bacterium]
NASFDNSLLTAKNIDLNLKIIKNHKNLGFAKASNQGVRDCKTDYILFLNPDVRLFKESLIIPINFMEKKKNKDIAIAGIQLLDENGKASRNCARFPTRTRFIEKALTLDRLFPAHFPGHFMAEWAHDNTRIVDQVMGSFFLIRTKVFKRLNGFDERYFVYFEDVDLSYRVHKIGLRSVYISAVNAYHKGGGTSEQVKAKRLFYSLQSRILYYCKHFPFFVAAGTLFSTLFIEFFSRIFFSALKGSFFEVLQTIKGYLYLILNSPKILKIIVKYRKIK